MSNYETMRKAGYTYLCYDEVAKTHNLYNLNTKEIEVFTASKNYSGWALKYKGTHLEFCNTKDDGYKAQFIRGLKYIQGYGEQHPSFMNAHNLLKRMQLI